MTRITFQRDGKTHTRTVRVVDRKQYVMYKNKLIAVSTLTRVGGVPIYLLPSQPPQPPRPNFNPSNRSHRPSTQSQPPSKSSIANAVKEIAKATAAASQAYHGEDQKLKEDIEVLFRYGNRIKPT
jgi:hypothetical protein